MSGNIVLSLERHPCYSHSAHFKYGRIHLPVAPECNLGCNYCERLIGGMTYHSYRPAVTEKILSPKEAVSEAGRYADDPRLTVIGIAGPGEPLYNPSTFETLRLVHENYPRFMICLSTNGLLLPEHVADLRNLGVRTLTVTLNVVEPELGKRIYAYVRYGGRLLRSIEGARFLLKKQLIGIQEAVRRGMIVKINSILIPGVNDGEHMMKVAKTASKLGAYVQNITPLIPLGKFRTLRAPCCDELRWIRSQCEKVIRQFWFCRQCRADSVGVPGIEHPQLQH